MADRVIAIEDGRIARDERRGAARRGDKAMRAAAQVRRTAATGAAKATGTAGGTGAPRPAGLGGAHFSASAATWTEVR